MRVIFIRHGEPDYECLKNVNIFNCTKNIAPLSSKGRKQARFLVDEYKNTLEQSELIISSPYTRALETASIINQKLNKKLVIDVDLHEWESDEDKYFFDSGVLEQIEKEFYKHKGVHNDDCKWYWESMNNLGNRVKNALLKYDGHDCIIVVCHAMIIRQFYYNQIIPNCYPIEVSIGADTKITEFHKE